MSGIVNFFKGQASSLVNAFSYGLTHLDQFSTAGDVIVVQHPDGTLHSTPFNVRFGKISVPRPSTKIVRIEVNGEAVTSVMKLKSDGTAYFVESTTGGDGTGGFPISPSQSPLSPPRSPTAEASQPPNSPPPGEEISLDPPKQTKVETPEDDPNLEKEKEQATENLPENDVVTVDEGSAIELAKQNPEIRDLVTSLVGESRAGEHQQQQHHHRNPSSTSASASASNNNSLHSPATPETINETNNNNNYSSSTNLNDSPPMHRQSTSQIGSGSGEDIILSADGGDSRSNNGSFSGGNNNNNKPGELRLSRFASSNNVEALNDMMKNDESFAAIVNKINEHETGQDYKLQQQRMNEQHPLKLAPSASRLTAGEMSVESSNMSGGSPTDSGANLLNETNNNFARNNNNQTPEIVSNQQAVSPDFRSQQQDDASAAAEPVQHQDTSKPEEHNINDDDDQQQKQQAAAVPEGGFQQPLIQEGSQLIEDDEFVDDSSDEDYDYFLQSAPQQQQKVIQQQQQKVEDQQQVDVDDVNDQTVIVSNSSLQNEHIDPLDSTGVGLDQSLSGGGKKAAYHATITPGHNELAKLNLKDGANIVKFIVYSQTLTRTTEVEARIFLWPYTAKVVISDIDGTVTKSDVMGHLSAILRWDWTHPGLCSLYTNIAKNEYKFLYLTARSLSQTSSTRSFLEGVAQDGQKLPDGPVFTATEKLFAALTQEVLKRSHIFKTECLTTVRQVFPKSLRHPLYAGFGNRIGDSIAYENVGIPLHKIFIIDESSVVHVCKVKQTYRDLSHLVDMTFPPISGKIPVQASQLPIHYSAVTVVSGQVRSSSPTLTQLAQLGSTSSLNSQMNALGQTTMNGQHQQQQPSPTLTATSDQSGGFNSARNHQNNNNNMNATNSATVSPQSSSTAGGFFPATTAASKNNNNNNSDLPSGGAVSTDSNSSSTQKQHQTPDSNNTTLSNQQQQQQQLNALTMMANSGGGNLPLPPPMGSTAAPSSGIFSAAMTAANHHHHHHHHHHGEDDMMEEKVDFNDWNFWRMDPTSLTNLKDGAGAQGKKSVVGEDESKKPSNNNNTSSLTSKTTTPARPGGSFKGDPSAFPTGAEGENTASSTQQQQQQQQASSTTEEANATNSSSSVPTSPNPTNAPPAATGWFSSLFSRASKPAATTENPQQQQDSTQQQDTTAVATTTTVVDQQLPQEKQQQPPQSPSSQQTTPRITGTPREAKSGQKKLESGASTPRALQ